MSISLDYPTYEQEQAANELAIDMTNATLPERIEVAKKFVIKYGAQERLNEIDIMIGSRGYVPPDTHLENRIAKFMKILEEREQS